MKAGECCSVLHTIAWSEGLEIDAVDYIEWSEALEIVTVYYIELSEGLERGRWDNSSIGYCTAEWYAGTRV